MGMGIMELEGMVGDMVVDRDMAAVALGNMEVRMVMVNNMAMVLPDCMGWGSEEVVVAEWNVRLGPVELEERRRGTMVETETDRTDSKFLLV